MSEAHLIASLAELSVEKATQSALLARNLSISNGSRLLMETLEQRYLHLIAEQESLMACMVSNIDGHVDDECRVENLGSLLSCLPSELVSEHILGRLPGSTVRCVSKGFRASFDSSNTKLSLRHSDPDQVVDLVLSSPKLQTLDVWACCRGRVQGLRAAAVRGHLKTLFLRFSDGVDAVLGEGGEETEPDDAEALVPALQSLTKLESLYLGRGNGPTGLNDREVLILSPSVRSLTALSALSISCGPLSLEGKEALISSLTTLSRLKSVELIVHSFGADGATGFALALEHLKELQSMQLRGTNIGHEGMMSLVPALSLFTGLQFLALSGNDIGETGALALAPGLKALTALHTLDLSDNSLGQSGAAALAPAFKFLTRLTEVWLMENQLDSEGAAVLTCSLKEASSLHTLWLGGNTLGVGAPVSVFIKALKDLKSLTKLGMINNSLASDQGLILIQELTMLTGLQTLRLMGNGLNTEKSIGILASMLEKLTSLQELDLANNSLMPDGVIAIVPALKKLHYLRVIDLRYNGVVSELPEEEYNREPHSAFWERSQSVLVALEMLKHGFKDLQIEVDRFSELHDGYDDPFLPHLVGI